MHLMPTNVQLTLTRRMSTLRLVCSFYRMASRLQLLPMALHRCLATFIHKLTSQLRFMDLLLLSGALHNPSSHPKVPLRPPSAVVDGTDPWLRFAILDCPLNS
jgi:hypothetical protein